MFQFLILLLNNNYTFLFKYLFFGEIREYGKTTVTIKYIANHILLVVSRLTTLLVSILTLQVHVQTDQTALKGKVCYSINDPHMRSFDGK